MATEKNKQTSTTVSFKSVGQKIDAFNAAENASAAVIKVPIGIKTPLELENGSLFKMNYSLPDQIADNLRNLIMTNKGERLGNPAFGSNLRQTQYATANKEDAEIEMMAKIQSAVKSFMPYVNLVDFTTTQLPPTMVSGDSAAGYQGGTLMVRITYSVPGVIAGTRGLQMLLPMAV